LKIREKIDAFVAKHPDLSAFIVISALLLQIVCLYFYYKQPKVVKVTETHQVTQSQKAKTSTGETVTTEQKKQSTTSGKTEKVVVNRVITIYEPSTGKVAQTITETSDTTSQEEMAQTSESASKIDAKTFTDETEHTTTDTTTTEKAVVVDDGRNVSSRLGAA
jgi:exopolysaccharide biosynthesis protein